MAKDHMSSIIALGGVTIDHVYVVDHHPDPDGVAHIQRNYTKVGGIAANAIVAAARLGGDVSFVGAVGDDQDGETAIDYLREASVDTRWIQKLHGDSTSYSIIQVSSHDQTRIILNYRGVQEGTELPQLTEMGMEDAGCLHVDGFWIDSALPLAQTARSEGIPVTLDISQNPRSDRIWELIRMSDYFIPSVFAARKLLASRFGEDPESLSDGFLSEGPNAVVITMGADGAYAKSRGERGVQIPAFPAKVLDTTGAGDTFHGAVAYGVTRGFDLEFNVRFSSAVAAIKCSSNRTDRFAFPSFEETRQFLEKHGFGGDLQRYENQIVNEKGGV